MHARLKRLLCLALPALLLGGCVAFRARPEATLPQPRPWGYDIAYPLPMASILASFDYLDRLRTCDGARVPYRRLGAVKRASALWASAPTPPEGLLAKIRAKLGLTATPGHILDRYELRLPTGTRVLWLDPYAGRTTTEAPEGLRLAPAP